MDLITRLREGRIYGPDLRFFRVADIHREAADRIEELTAALAAEIADKMSRRCSLGFDIGTCPPSDSCGDCDQHRRSLTALRRPLPAFHECDQEVDP